MGMDFFCLFLVLWQCKWTMGFSELDWQSSAWLHKSMSNFLLDLFLSWPIFLKLVASAFLPGKSVMISGPTLLCAVRAGGNLQAGSAWGINSIMITEQAQPSSLTCFFTCQQPTMNSLERKGATTFTFCSPSWLQDFHWLLSVTFAVMSTCRVGICIFFQFFIYLLCVCACEVLNYNWKWLFYWHWRHS